MSIPGKAKGLHGQARRRALGLRTVTIEFTQEEFDALERACAIERRSKANFITLLTLQRTWQLVNADDLNRLRHLDRRNAERIESDSNSENEVIER